MTKRQEQLRLLGMVCAGFLLPAAVLLGLLFIPATAKPLSYVFGPYLPGIFLQLMLLAMVGLAAIGEIPRWVLALPLAVWLGGIGYWWIERQAVRDRILASAQRIEFPVPADPIVVDGRGMQTATLAQALVSVYDVGAVYGAPFKYTMSEGARCESTPENNRQGVPWKPDFLARQGKCVIRERAPAPAGGIEVVIRITPAKIENGVVQLNLFAPSIQSTPIEIFQRGKPDAIRTKFEIRQERGPLPILLPVAGCWHVMTEKPECAAYLMRAPGMLDANPDRTATGYGFLDNNAYFIASALGLKRRPASAAVSQQSQAGQQSQARQ